MRSFLIAAAAMMALAVPTAPADADRGSRHWRSGGSGMHWQGQRHWNRGNWNRGHWNRGHWRGDRGWRGHWRGGPRWDRHAWRGHPGRHWRGRHWRGHWRGDPWRWRRHSGAVFVGGGFGWGSGFGWGHGCRTMWFDGWGWRCNW